MGNERAEYKKLYMEETRLDRPRSYYRRTYPWERPLRHTQKHWLAMARLALDAAALVAPRPVIQWEINRQSTDPYRVLTAAGLLYVLQALVQRRWLRIARLPDWFIPPDTRCSLVGYELHPREDLIELGDSLRTAKVPRAHAKLKVPRPHLPWKPKVRALFESLQDGTAGGEIVHEVSET